MPRVRVQSPCLEAALEYLSRGWSAIPLCPPDHDRVSLYHQQSCRNPGKCPLWPWKEYQTRLPREAELRLFWNRNPKSNVGVILGRVSGLVGFDIDGPEAEAILERVCPNLPQSTLEFATPGGGRRLLYAIEKDRLIEKRRFDHNGSHVIVLGEGSLTVMPPSIHPNGGMYE
jgi:hypothetical protein